MNRHRDRGLDRRREERVTGIGLRARLRPGYRLVVVDLSPSGALVEGVRPLRPGSHVDLHLESEARAGIVTARVVRCAVAAIDAERGVTYRAALCFNGDCGWVREAMTPGGYGIPSEGALEMTPPLEDVDRLPGGNDEAMSPQTKVLK